MYVKLHVCSEHSPISMAIFYERVPHAPYIWNSLKMTVEWLHNRCYIKQEALISFYNVCCSTFELCFRKKNIFLSYYNTIMDFFFGNSSAKSTFKILAQNNSPADIVSARYFTFMKSHVHRLKSCGQPCPQLLSLFSRQLHFGKMFADTMSAGGLQFQFRGHNRHRNRRVLICGMWYLDV